jgi:hypothetical protein
MCACALHKHDHANGCAVDCRRGRCRKAYETKRGIAPLLTTQHVPHPDRVLRLGTPFRRGRVLLRHHRQPFSFVYIAEWIAPIPFLLSHLTRHQQPPNLNFRKFIRPLLSKNTENNPEITPPTTSSSSIDTFNADRPAPTVAPFSQTRQRNTSHF